jgi:hypothetical protein
VHPATVHFDDYKGALAGKRKIRLSEIRVIHDGIAVYGIEGIYTSEGPVISGGVHHGSALNPRCVNQSIPLPEGTNIIKVYGKSGEFIDQLVLELSNGVTYVFGGYGGVNSWKIDLPEGKYVKAFAGGVGETVQSLLAYY